jgi:hypothetical protein
MILKEQRNSIQTSFGWKIEKWEGLANNMEYRTINTTDDKGNKGIGGYDEKNASRIPHYKLRRC